MAYADRVLDALGNPTRRLVFKRLRSGARSVGEIAEGMDVSRPAVSQHLMVLKQAGLVVARAEGTRRLYAVAEYVSVGFSVITSTSLASWALVAVSGCVGSSSGIWPATSNTGSDFWAGFGSCRMNF